MSGENREMGPIPVRQIPADLTENKAVIIKKVGGGNSDIFFGTITNGPIEVGKQIIFGIGNTSRVVEINRTGDTFSIRTGGSEYTFDPKDSTDFPS